MLKCAPSRTQYVQARGSTASIHEISFPLYRSKSHEASSGRLRWTAKLIHTFQTSPSPLQCLDWSNTNADIIALGHQDGSVNVFGVSDRHELIQIPARQQRSCSSIKFNTSNLLAIGLEKVRNDASMTIYDVQAQSPFSLFANSEGVSSLDWVPNDPHCIIAGLNYRWLRLIDIRMDPREACAAVSMPTKAVHEISTDPNDVNCFASMYEDNVLLWDRRKPDVPSLLLKAGNGSENSRIRQLRFAPDKRGHLTSMSDNGVLDVWHLSTNDLVQDDYRVCKHQMHTDINLMAFDFVDLASPFAKSCNIVVLPSENDSASLRSLRLSSPSGGYNNLGDYILLDENRLSFDQSPLRDVIKDDLGSEDPSKCKTMDEDGASRDEDLESDRASLDELPAHSPFVPLLSSQLTESNNIDYPASFVPEVVDEQGSGELSSSMHADISHTMHRRARCGYGMDAETNLCLISDDYSSLKTVWRWLSWSAKASVQGKLNTDSFDFALEGCLNIWKGIGGNPRQMLSPHSEQFYVAVRSINQKFPIDVFPDSISQAPLRQLSLTAMGWCLTTAELNTFQNGLKEEGRYDKAAFYALAQNQDVDEAIKILETSGVQMEAAVLDYVRATGDDEASRIWKRSCNERGVDLDSPYMRAIFAYLSAHDWRDVIDEQGLTLRERIALCIRYMREEEVTAILHDLCRTEVAEGNLEGLLLTGINNDSLDLLQTYVDRTGDVQTAALIGSLKAKVSHDIRILHWVSEYENLLRTWGLHIVRCRFSLARNRIAQIGRRNKVPPRQACIRCNHCNTIVNAPSGANDTKKRGGAIPPTSGYQSTGCGKSTICTKCRKPLPKCVLCLLPVGGENILNFCLTCNHTLHRTHADQWFATHRQCPAPNCHCECRTIS